MNEKYNLDVYYVDSNTHNPIASFANVVRSWDDSLYIETNIKELAGPQQEIRVLDHSTIFINNVMINGGLSLAEQYLLLNQ